MSTEVATPQPEAGPPRITTKLVSDICKEKGFYRLPELNEKLYLHFKGFAKIESLDEFYECRALWLENNCIGAVENLEKLAKLLSLFLHHNSISSFLADPPTTIKSAGDDYDCNYRIVGPTGEDEPSQPVESIPPLLRVTSGPLPSVRSLNISHNFLTSLRGVGFIFPNLEQLIANHNQIRGVTDCRTELAQLAALTVLDLSHNKIADLFEDDGFGGGVKIVDAAPAQQTLGSVLFGAASPAAEGNASSSTSAIPDAVARSPQAAPLFASLAGGNTEKQMNAVATIATIAALPRIASLMLHGNAVTRNIKLYRKFTIAALPALKYLDEYPIFDDERRCVEAFFLKGGADAEREEREAIKAEKEQKRLENLEAFDAMVNEAREQAAGQTAEERAQPTNHFHAQTQGPAPAIRIPRTSDDAAEEEDDFDNIHIPA